MADPGLGDFASLTLACDFSPITPLGAIFFGDPIAMSATSTFPIRLGCVNCPTPAPVTPPPAPLQCRPVPDVEGMSVAGARLAWASAGFDPAKFTPSTGQDHRTVASFVVNQNDPLSTCNLPALAVFSSTIVVTVTPPDPATPPTCVTVPNLVGTLVGGAAAAWTGAGFTGDLTADGGDPSALAPNRVITSQVTAPTSEIGVDCLDPASTVNVVTGDPLPVPPPRPCRVPNMINLTRRQGEAEWIRELFAVGNFSPANGNFTIKSQSVVGGTYLPWTAPVTVSAQRRRRRRVMTTLLHRFVRRDRTRGQSLVEFALILPILLILMLGIVDFGRAIFAYNAVSNGARSGARVAIVNQDIDDITAAVEARHTGSTRRGRIRPTWRQARVSGERRMLPAIGCIMEVPGRSVLPATPSSASSSAYHGQCESRMPIERCPHHEVRQCDAGRVRIRRGQTLVIVGVGMVVLVGMVGVMIDVGCNGETIEVAERSEPRQRPERRADGVHAGRPKTTPTSSMPWRKSRPKAGRVERRNTPTGRARCSARGGWQRRLHPVGGSRRARRRTRTHETVFARVFGVNELSVNTDATAVSGPSSRAAKHGAVRTPAGDGAEHDRHVRRAEQVRRHRDPWIGPPTGPEYIIPLCGNNPGSVGWIDWTPPGGGSDELEGQMCEPEPIDLNFPDWYYVTSTGNMNSGNVQNCWDKWIGKDILIPYSRTRVGPTGDVDQCTDPAPIGGRTSGTTSPKSRIHLTGSTSRETTPTSVTRRERVNQLPHGNIRRHEHHGEPGEWIPGDKSMSQIFGVQLID